jgi:hypothetical protein
MLHITVAVAAESSNTDVVHGPRLWMIVDAIRNRNYLYGYDIYMRLAIGGTYRIF